MFKITRKFATDSAKTHTNVETNFAADLCGTPQYAHDAFHEIVDDVIKLMKKDYTFNEVLDFEEKLSRFGYDVQSPANFNFSGERIVMPMQGFLSGFEKLDNTMHWEFKGNSNEKILHGLARNIELSLRGKGFEITDEAKRQINELFLVKRNFDQDNLSSQTFYKFKTLYDHIVIQANLSQYKSSAYLYKDMNFYLELILDNPELKNVIMDSVLGYTMYTITMEDSVIKSFNLQLDITRFQEKSRYCIALDIIFEGYQLISGLNSFQYILGGIWLGTLLTDFYLDNSNYHIKHSKAGILYTFDKNSPVSVLEHHLTIFDSHLFLDKTYLENSFHIEQELSVTPVVTNTIKAIGEILRYGIDPKYRLADPQEIYNKFYISFTSTFLMKARNNNRSQIALTQYLESEEFKEISDQLVVAYGYCNLDSFTFDSPKI